jgi:hypothetical protein
MNEASFSESQLSTFYFYASSITLRFFASPSLSGGDRDRGWDPKQRLKAYPFLPLVPLYPSSFPLLSPLITVTSSTFYLSPHPLDLKNTLVVIFLCNYLLL